MKKFITIIIIAFIFGSAIYLLTRLNPKTGVKFELKAQTTSSTEEEWSGIFINNKKVGYSFSRITRTDTGLTVENITRMTLFMMTQPRTLTTHTFVHTDAEYTLKDFSLTLQNQGEQRLEGRIEGNKLYLTSFIQGKKYTQTRELTEKPYFPDAIPRLIQKKGLKPGDEITLPYFDPTTQSSTQARLKVVGKEKVDVLGKEMTGMRIEINIMGLNSTLWIDDNYQMIKQSTPAMRMETVRLSKAEALAEIKPTDAFDLLSFFSVKLEEPIPDPKKLDYLKLSLENIDTTGLDLVDDYQVLVTDAPITLEFHLPDISELQYLSIPINEKKEFLKPTVFIQCKDEKIINTAQKIVGKENDAKKAVAKLVDGVYKMLKKDPTASLPSALDVLATKKGDCNEHSILFTALARAVGIPTKIYVGLINLNGYAYYYHAWCAVWLGKWIPVDPTFDQFPADVGHLKLKEGGISEQARVLKVVGKLKIDILDFHATDSQ
ncbi:hypothetical protein BXT86_00220 [candidate division WOR-3 bacterium 4484_100]|uniref:Transglutaminase-like domain-containing protein n=1 Tax=candidate division WOR-3 bacterium 4484_100 TaxID=1936077 RepID=A0A1V4QHA1_UNCW3|nr:MAG: hypothetical protein BXT86_00220 [candidate division WOR-3 bacterium 4484_100]